MPQRDWGCLSPRTQKRYTGAGKQFGWAEAETRVRYEAGESLKALRGHARTPERPERASRNPSAFPEYRRSGGKTMRVVGRGMLTSDVRNVDHLSKDERTLIGQYRYAVERFLSGEGTGDYTNRQGKRVRGLDWFTGKSVNGVEFETRYGPLEDMYARGELDEFLQSVYPPGATA